MGSQGYSSGKTTLPIAKYMILYSVVVSYYFFKSCDEKFNSFLKKIVSELECVRSFAQ